MNEETFTMIDLQRNTYMIDRYIDADVEIDKKVWLARARRACLEYRDYSPARDSLWIHMNLMSIAFTVV